MKSIRRISLYSCLFLFCGINTMFSQLRWDSLEKITTASVLYNAGINVMYADSNYFYMAGMFTVIGGQHIQGIARWNGIKWDSMGTGIDGKYYLTRSRYPKNTWAFASYQNKLYVGGEFASLGNINAFGIGTWNGTAWDSVPIQPFKISWNYPALSGTVEALAVINNKLYMGGGFDTVAGFPCIGIASWDGTKWSGLGFPDYGNLFTAIDAICEYNGSIYVGGTFYDSTLTDSTANILRYDGTKWHAVGGGIKGLADGISSMVVYNGELYVGGEFLKSEGNAGNNIQKWDGVKWSDVGGGTDNEVFDLMVYNGKLYAMGQVTQVGGISASKIATWDGTKWCSLGSTFDNSITSACVYKDSLYIGGDFNTIDGDSIIYVTEWTGGSYVADCGQPTGVNQLKINNEQLIIYPNPSNGIFNIVIANEAKQSLNTIEVYDVLGEKVYQSNINSDNTEINLSNQPNGVYLYRVITLTGEFVGEGKVIVQR